MVKALRLLVMSGVLFLPLVSCQLLFMGFFPASAGQATARVDLSSSIDSTPASYFSLSTVTSGGAEYFILFTSLPFDSSKIHVVILDSTLKILKTFTLDDISPLPPGGIPLSGRYTMTECLDQVVIGNVWLDVQPGAVVITDKRIPPISLDQPSVRGRPQFDYNETNFRINGGFFLYDEYDLFWGPTGTLGNCPVGTPTPPPQSQLDLFNVFTDPNSSAAPDVFLFQDGSGNRTYFLQIPKFDIENDLGSFVGGSDVFTYAAANYPPLVVKSNLARESISYSKAGIIAYDESSDALIRFTLDDPDNVSSLSLTGNNGMNVVAAVSGTYCVVWDPKTRALTRYEQWW